MTRKAAGFAAQMREDARQHGVLVHVGKIAGMERVLIIHRGGRKSVKLPRRRRQGAAITESSSMFFESATVADHVHPPSVRSAASA